MGFDTLRQCSIVRLTVVKEKVAKKNRLIVSTKCLLRKTNFKKESMSVQSWKFDSLKTIHDQVHIRKSLRAVEVVHLSLKTTVLNQGSQVLVYIGARQVK